MAQVRPRQLEKHGHVRIDDYYWLRERDDPEVLAFLERENERTRQALAPTEALQERLYREIVARIPEEDASVPFRIGDAFYYQRFERGAEYAVHCRKRGSLEAEEEILLDGNELAAGESYFDLEAPVVSPDQRWLAFACDTLGRRLFRLRFKDLETEEILPEELTDVTGNLVWANDSRTLFYTRQHPETLRWYRVYRHRLGEDPATDELVYEEADETFNVKLRKSRSRRFLLLEAEQTISSEVHVLDADEPNGRFVPLQPRRRSLEYEAEHHGDYFYIRTNLEAPNFRLVRAPVEKPGIEHWEDVLPARAEVFLEGFEVFRDHLVLLERENGLVEMRVRRWADGGEHRLAFPDPAYDAFPRDNHEFDSHSLRYRYSSLTTPWSVFDHDMETGETVLRKRVDVCGDFDPTDYVGERLHVVARDGARIPVSLVYRKGFRKDGSHPLLEYAYGSYGVTVDPTFVPWRLSLLDRGFVFAIAHVRGSQALGRPWYEEGKLLKKQNTFTDFIDVGELLVEEGYTSKDRLFAEGRSAGGLLMGAVANMAPDLYHGIVAGVPFVDVVTTMLDSDLPLTTSEYDEWGDPNRKEFYDYMLSYSPYDNVRAQAYPHLLVLTSLNDSQVQYFEPAKWVAKLRSAKTDDRLLLLDTDMDSGHCGSSGRFLRHRKTALTYAFLLDLAGIGE